MSNAHARSTTPVAVRYPNNGTMAQNYSSSFDRQKYYDQPRHYNSGIAYNCNTGYNGVDSRTRQASLRRRGSSDPDRSEESSYYRHNNNRGNHDRIEGFATRRTHISNTTISTTRMARIFTLVVVSMLMFWGSLWGIESCIGLSRVAINMVLGERHDHQLDDESVFGSGDLSSEDGTEDFSEDPSEVLIHENSAGLRGSFDPHNNSGHPGAESEETPQGLSVHDLNARSHLLKAEGRQIINDKPMAVDEDGKGEKSYMGNDSTHDLFFAGATIEEKRLVNRKGRIETKSYPAHSYALLPVLLDSNPFSISIWINLSPLTKSDENNGVFEDSRRPRVILSTRSENYSGCHSDVFGERPATGIVLYAQPHYDDKAGNDAEANTYQVVFEYARAGKKLCRTLIGSSKNVQLIREGEWHHITIFATRMSTESEEERISLYVDGDLSGRNEHELRQFSSYHSNPKTTIGRYATQVGSKVELSAENNATTHWELDGRVGMLSFWETGGHSTLSTDFRRMTIESASNEDHVVRAINRAAFDIRAIRELSLQGSFLKEPTLLYTFDGQNQHKVSNELYSEYSESPHLIEEVISGRDGSIMSELIDGMLVHQRQAFIPLGANRYSEYKDGTFVPPKLKASERKDLNEIARARSGIVKKAMQHAWNGYEKYAFGKDELLPISRNGQDNWGGQGTTLVDSLSTLWIMGMKKEFNKARDWVRDYLDFSQVKGGVSVFETTIRNLGGLLSAYDLSGDKVFLDKADDLGMRLMRAFDSRTGIPYGEVELFDGGHAYNTGWHSNQAVLSEIGTLQVEFRYLAKITGKSEYATNAMRALDELLKLDAEFGLYPTFIYNSKQPPSFGNSDISIGAMGDSFYEYLLKVWLQGGKREMKYRHMYDKSVNGIIDKLVHMSRPNYLTYVAELKRGRVVHKMDHLSCFLGGNLALGAYTHPNGLDSLTAQRQLKTGKQLAYVRSVPKRLRC